MNLIYLSGVKKKANLAGLKFWVLYLNKNLLVWFYTKYSFFLNLNDREKPFWGKKKTKKHMQFW